jgi:hypothetical protein
VIEAKSSRSGKKTEDYLKGLTQRRMFPGPRLDTYGMRGVDALSNATPKDTSETSKKWGYRIVEWFNTNIVDGNQIAVLIQYGHATGTGGYVVGRDYINPAMQPIFDDIADEVWKKVKR